MIGISVIRLISLIPVIQNDISRFRNDCSILNPDSFCLEDLNMLFASALCTDQVNHSSRDCCCRYGRITPLISVLHCIASRQRLVTVIQVDNLLELSICLAESKPAAPYIQIILGCSSHISILLIFCIVKIIHVYVSVDSRNLSFVRVLMISTRHISFSGIISQPEHIFFNQIRFIHISVVIKIRVNSRSISLRLYISAEFLCEQDTL